MYWIKILHNSTKKESTIEFDNREEALLFRDYHIKFSAWGKTESWLAEKYISPLHKKLIVAEKIEHAFNSKKEAVEVKYFKISPEYKYLGDNLGTIETELFWDKFRKERNKALRDSDCAMLADFPLTTNNSRVLYREYREFLRNLPLNYNDSTISNYKVMSFEEWKEFFRKIND